VAEREAEVEDLIEQARELYPHLVVEIKVDAQGGISLKSRMPTGDEQPSITVHREPLDPKTLLHPGQHWGDYAEEVTQPVSVDMYWRNKGMKHEAVEFGEGLGAGALQVAVGAAIARRSDDIVEVARRVGAGQESRVTIEEVARAQRDLYFLMQTALHVLGKRENYDDGTAIYPQQDKKTGRNAYTFSYKTTTETVDFEGDFEDASASEIDILWAEGTPYKGTMTVTVDPEKRISFSYRPDQASAQRHHTTEDIAQRGDKLVHHGFDDLNLRIDLDPKSPAGVAVDFGRSEYESDTYLRDPDLLGRVMEIADPENGSHTYDGFTPDMQEQFRPMAEGLIVKLALSFNERDAMIRVARARRELSERREAGRPVSEHDRWLMERVGRQALLHQWRI